MRSWRLGAVLYYGFVLGAGLFSVLVGISALGYLGTATGRGLLALWSICAGMAVLIKVRMDSRRLRATSRR
jgi:hypothetical protein